MAMTPEERREFDELKTLVQSLLRVENVPFIESAKRRITNPVIDSLGLDQAVSKETTGNTSGVLKSVNEAGAAVYDVADAYDGTITVTDVDGNSYKLGYYN